MQLLNEDKKPRELSEFFKKNKMSSHFWVFAKKRKLRNIQIFRIRYLPGCGGRI